MKIQWITLSALIASLVLLSAGCKDKDKCHPGGGGEVSLILKPEHHGEAIYGQTGYPDSAFVAFGETEFPGDDPLNYDVIEVGSVGSNQVVVNNLKCGKYYVFMTGLDTSIAERVKGGIPINISENSGSVTIVVPVTED